MKKILSLFLILSLVLIAGAAYATIGNTLHNLTSTSGNTTRTNDATATLCGFCHVPHGGQTGTPGLPLWGRQDPAGPFTIYGAGGQTLQGTVLTNPPGKFSLTCLSCHDGTVAVGVVTKNGANITYNMIGNVTAGDMLDPTAFAGAYNPVIGQDLTNDHPVGFQFPAAGYIGPPGPAAGGLPGITVTVMNPGLATAYINGAAGDYPVFQVGGTDRFECATCHDPHAEDNVTYGLGASKFLRSANAAFCQDCHNVK